MTYYNIKSYKKPGLQPFFRRYIFGKTAGGRDQIAPALLIQSTSALLIQSIQESFMLRKSVKSRGIDLMTTAKSKSSKSHVVYYMTSRTLSDFFVT